MAYARVKAVRPGQYAGIFRDVGDVFDIQNAGDFSNALVSQVPVGNPIYPFYGWMLQVPSNSQLVSFALSNGGASSNVSGSYVPNAVGVANLSIPGYVE